MLRLTDIKKMETICVNPGNIVKYIILYTSPLLEYLQEMVAVYTVVDRQISNIHPLPPTPPPPPIYSSPASYPLPPSI